MAGMFSIFDNGNCFLIERTETNSVIGYIWPSESKGLHKLQVQVHFGKHPSLCATSAKYCERNWLLAPLTWPYKSWNRPWMFVKHAAGMKLNISATVGHCSTITEEKPTASSTTGISPNLMKSMQCPSTWLDQYSHRQFESTAIWSHLSWKDPNLHKYMHKGLAKKL